MRRVNAIERDRTSAELKDGGVRHAIAVGIDHCLALNGNTGRELQLVDAHLEVDDRIVSVRLAEVKGVRVRASEETIVPEATVEEIKSGTTIETVVPVVTVELIPPVPTEQSIVAVAADQPISAAPTIQDVGPIEPFDGFVSIVCTIQSVDLVAALLTGNSFEKLLIFPD